MRRVVVTGLGAVTPLGVGIRRSWTRLLAGQSGVVSVADRQPADRWAELTSTVAGIVPEGKGQGKAAGQGHGEDDGLWDPSRWLAPADIRRMSRFTQYAVAASDMALADAGLSTASDVDRENTGVCLGSGIGNLDDMYETSLAHDRGVRTTTFAIPCP